jgi:hypothetical protein
LIRPDTDGITAIQGSHPVPTPYQLWLTFCSLKKTD